MFLNFKGEILLGGPQIMPELNYYNYNYYSEARKKSQLSPKKLILEMIPFITQVYLYLKSKSRLVVQRRIKG